MQFRPCIDIHNGCVKQIVGGSLTDVGDKACENFVSEKDAGYYARIYKEYGLTGGHVIMLNSRNSEYFEATKEQALKALREYPGGLQIGGGITDQNAAEYIEAGASHVIVTSFVFEDGVLREDRLRLLVEKVGKEHIVLDLSCKYINGEYHIVTDRWQKSTSVILNKELFDRLSDCCDEFLVHAVNVEGTGLGIDSGVLEILSKVPYTVTYAGGISDYKDIKDIKNYGNGNVNFTIGSRLVLFGGNLGIEEVLECIQ